MTPSTTPPGSADHLQDGIRLTVAGVAARLGVAAPTLRTWARRYGLGPSGHVAGSHRRYDGADLARLEAMRRLTLEGVAPADAAEIALRSVAGVDGANRTDGGEGAGTGRTRSAQGQDDNGQVDNGQDTDGRAANSQVSRGDALGAGAEPAEDEPMVADPLTVAAAAVDGDHRRLARLIRRAGREHGLLEGWLMAVRPAVEMVSQRPQPDRPGHDPGLLLHAQMMAVLAEATTGPDQDRAHALVHFAPPMSTDAHVLAAELTVRGAHVRVSHERLEGDHGQPLLDLAERHEDTVTVILGESAVAERLVQVLCERGQQVFLVALTDAIDPRPGLHRARTLSGAVHEIMSLIT